MRLTDSPVSVCVCVRVCVCAIIRALPRRSGSTDWLSSSTATLLQQHSWSFNKAIASWHFLTSVNISLIYLDNQKSWTFPALVPRDKRYLLDSSPNQNQKELYYQVCFHTRNWTWQHELPVQKKVRTYCKPTWYADIGITIEMEYNTNIRKKLK